MKLYTDKGEIALPEDFTFEISHHNPFFSEEGADTLPVTLPASLMTLELLDHPDDTHRNSRAVRTFEAQISEKVFFASCRLVVDSVSLLDGISASLALKESIMYIELRDRRLRDIFGGRFEESSASFWNIYHGQRKDIWGDPDPVAERICIFPVAVDMRDDDGDAAVSLINEPGENSFIESSRPVVIGGREVIVPQGYGVAPFLYLWGLIDLTFTMSGYTVGTNVFRSDPVLKDIVVLHNTADTQVRRETFVFPNELRYGEMVPDITVGGLLTYLHDKFGAVVTSDNGRVDIRLFRDLASSGYDLDLSPYATEDATITWPEPSGLTLECDTSIDGASPAAETLEALVATYKTRAEVMSVEQISGSGLFYVLPLGKYYYRKTASDQPVLIGTDAMRYERSTGLTSESINAGDSYVPQIRHNGRYLPYVGKSVRRYTEVAGDADDAFSQQLMICYAHFDDESGVYSASSYGYDETGAAVSGYPPLTPEGCAATYWSRYHQLLADGCPGIECTLEMPLEDLLGMDIATPKRLNGDIVMIREIRFALGGGGLITCQASMVQLSEYSDSIEIPVIEMTGNISWQIVNTRSIFAYGDTSDGIVITATDGITDYKSTDAPVETPSRAGIVYGRRKRWLKYTRYTSTRNFWGWSKATTPWYHEYEEYFITSFRGQ